MSELGRGIFLALSVMTITSCFWGFMNIVAPQDLETISVTGYLCAFLLLYLGLCPDIHLITTYWHLRVMSAQFWHCSHSNSSWMKIRLWAYGIFRQRNPLDTCHLWQTVINILDKNRHTHMHTQTPLQPHPSLPWTYFPAPVVNCIPLDDITGNKNQQDNKRSEPQSTSFISDFITPQLMDVDLCTLFHLTCSILQPTPPPFFSDRLSHTVWRFLFIQCYLWSCD